MSVSLIDGHVDNDAMTDEQIIKALECHSDRNIETCSLCPLMSVEGCAYELAKNSLYLINRYKADIERYKGVIKLLEKDVAEAKVEAYKEVAERIKQIICDHCYPDFNKDGKPINVWNATNGYKAIDNLVKERIGDDNADKIKH